MKLSKRNIIIEAMKRSGTDDLATVILTVVDIQREQIYLAQPKACEALVYLALARKGLSTTDDFKRALRAERGNVDLILSEAKASTTTPIKCIDCGCILSPPYDEQQICYPCQIQRKITPRPVKEHKVKSFSSKFQTLLAERGWTHVKVADLVGVSKRTVLRWCNGERKPQSKSIQRELAKVLNMSDCELMEIF